MECIDHIGVAVFDLDQSILAYQRDFGMKLDFREELPDRGVALAFLSLRGSTTIELLAALNEKTVVKKFLDTHGPGVHHIAYKVDDIAAEILRLSALGHTPIDLQPRPGARGSLIAFFGPKSLGGVLTELVQPAKR